MTPEQLAQKAADLQAKAIEETGGSMINSVFEIAFAADTSGGAFTVAIGAPKTPAIPFGVGALTLQLALCGLITVGVGGCAVRGPKGGPYEIEMMGENAGQDVALPVVDGSGLIPVQLVQVTQLEWGETNDYAAKAAKYWADADNVVSLNHRFLLTKLALIDYRLGRAVDATDTRTGQANVVDRKENQRYTNLLTMRNLVFSAIETEIGLNSGEQNRSFGGKIRQTTPNNLPYGVLRPPFWGRR